jgi:hypothetical protein
VLGQSGGAERRHHLVKFQLKPVVYREVRCDREFTTASKQKKKKKKKWRTELRRESRCSSRVLNVGKAYAIMQLEQ